MARNEAPSRRSMRDRMRENAERASSGGASYIKAPEGKKITWFQPKAKDDGFALDFLPYEVSISNHPLGLRPGDLWPSRKFKVHYGIGAEEKAYVCPKSIGQPCPICEERANMANDANLSKADEKLMADLKPKDRTLYQLIDLDEEKKGVQLWDYSYHLFEKRLLNDINKTEHSAPGRRRTTPHGGFADLEGGQTLTLSFIEKQMGSNKFLECDRIDADDRDPYEEEILDEVLDLDTILEVLPYDKLRAIFLATDDHHEDKEERGGRRRGKTEEESPADEEKPSRRRREPEPEPEEEKPSRRRRGGEGEEPPAEEPAGRRRRGASEEPPAEEPPTRRRRGEPEPEPEEEKPAGRRRRGEPDPEPEPAPSRSRRGKSDDPECLGKGEFGKDFEKYDECFDCPDEIYQQCQDRSLGK